MGDIATDIIERLRQMTANMDPYRASGRLADLLSSVKEELSFLTPSGAELYELIFDLQDKGRIVFTERLLNLIYELMGSCSSCPVAWAEEALDLDETSSDDEVIEKGSRLERILGLARALLERFGLREAMRLDAEDEEITTQEALSVIDRAVLLLMNLLSGRGRIGERLKRRLAVQFQGLLGRAEEVAQARYDQAVADVGETSSEATEARIELETIQDHLERAEARVEAIEETVEERPEARTEEADETTSDAVEEGDDILSEEMTEEAADTVEEEEMPGDQLNKDVL